jgi:ankyrin repeat protein
MRLLEIIADGEYSLTEDLNDNIPQYAILSHTWGSDNEEVTYKDFVDGNAEDKPGYSKLQFCGKQASNDGLRYFWVDTCCIDKSNNTELAEAINSMFRWYRDAIKCYAYLLDVSSSDHNNNQISNSWQSEFQNSRWFTRGWTLQELIAPKSVEFFSLDGQKLGDKTSLEDQIHDITGIPVQALRGNLSQFTVEERMQWAAKRKTRRREDAAYCLLGIFEIYMPLLYGEGKEHAFIRLKEEIEKASKHKSLVRISAPLSKRDGGSKNQDNTSPIVQGRKRQESNTPIMEIISSDFGISTLFNVCMVILQRMEPNKDFRIDEPHVSAQFDADKQRLKRWAKELGISYVEWNEIQDPRLRDPDLAVIIKEALNSVCDLFDPTGQIRSQSNFKTGTEERSYSEIPVSFTENSKKKKLSSNSITNGGEMVLSSTSTNSRGEKVARKGSSSSHTVGLEGKQDVTGWSIKRRGKFTNQVDMLKNIVDTLYNLVPPTRDAQANLIRQLQDQMGSLRIQNDIQFLLQDARRRAKERAQISIETWLDMTNFDQKYGMHQHYDKQLSSRLDETCEWIFQKPEYIKWVSMDDTNDESKLLWIYGRAGCGKTVLCAKLIEHFKANYESPVAFFFSSPHATSAGDPIFIIRSWITQIILLDSDAFELVRGYSGRRNGTRRASEIDVWCIFDYILAERDNITLILDGFDEYPRSGDGRAEFLRRLKKSTSGTTTRILISSREEIDIKAELSTDNNQTSGQIFIECMITKDDVQQDVTLYSRSVVDKKLPKKDEILREKLAGKLAERCDGMFLWIKMQQEQLRSGKSGKQLEKIVENMPLGLTETYERNWKMIKSRPIMEQYRAFAILRWTMFAFRPLSISELSAALIVKPDEVSSSLDLEELPDDIDDEYIDGEIIDICGSLVEARRETTGAHPGSRTVHLIHSSVREFLLSVLPIWREELSNHFPVTSQVASESDYHDYLTRVCLGYLNDENIWDISDEKENPWDKYPFLEYAARFWHSHISFAKLEDSENLSVVNDFFSFENENFQKWAKYFETFHNKEENKEENKDNTAGTPLYYAALFNLLPTMEYTWSQDKSQLDTIGGQYGTPLQATCAKGNQQAFEMLKNWGADPNIEGGEFGVALNAAAAGGWKNIVIALVDSGTQLELQDSMGRTGLYTAAKNGFLDIVKFLLTAGSELKMQNKGGWTPVNSAADGGYTEVVTLLLDQGAEINTQNHDGWTPVNSAADSGHLEVVRLLLDRGADINTPNNEGWTPVNAAADSGHLEVVRLLLDRGGDFNIPDKNGWTPISSAAFKGHVEVVRLLLDRKVEVNAPNPNWYKPLDLAADAGHVEVVRLLLDKGADINAPDNNGWTPINSAANRGHVGVVRLLLNRGADCNIPSNNGFTPIKSASNCGQIEIVQLILDQNVDVNYTGNDGWTSLNLAVFYGYDKLAQLLLDRGAKINLSNSNGWTPLNSAVGSGKIETTRLLLEKGADVNIPTKEGWTPINTAADAGHFELVKLLLDYEADADIKNHGGWTPLHSAADKSFVEVVKLLLDHGVIVNTPNKTGWTALNSASFNGNVEIVRLLLDHDADVKIATNGGRTPIHSAAICGEIQLFPLLIPIQKHLSTSKERESGRDQIKSVSRISIPNETPSIQSSINALCDYYGTALHAAAHKSHLNVLQILLETYDADITIIDHLGRTPLHIAAKMGNIECFNYLLDKGLSSSDADNGGKTVLHYACSGASIEVVERILQSDSNLINENSKWTSLHWACKTGTPELIKLLLKHECHESSVQTFQPPSFWTPISIALFHNNPHLRLTNQTSLNELFGFSIPSSSEKELDLNHESVSKISGSRHGTFYCDRCLSVSNLIIETIFY